MTNVFALLAQSDSLQLDPSQFPGSPSGPSGAEAAAGGIVGILFVVVYLAIFIFMIAAMWKVFEKANQPGWAVIVPVYNIIVMLKIAQRPLWWILLFFIPCVSIIPGIIVPVDIAKKFNKGVGFAIGMIFLPFIFYPILAFGSAEYNP